MAIPRQTLNPKTGITTFDGLGFMPQLRNTGSASEPDGDPTALIVKKAFFTHSNLNDAGSTFTYLTVPLQGTDRYRSIALEVNGFIGFAFPTTSPTSQPTPALHFTHYVVMSLQNVNENNSLFVVKEESSQTFAFPSTPTAPVAPTTVLLSDFTSVGNPISYNSVNNRFECKLALSSLSRNLIFKGTYLLI